MSRSLPDNPLNRASELTALPVLSVREHLELEGRGSAVGDVLAGLLRADDEFAGGSFACPGECLVAVGGRAGRGG